MGIILQVNAHLRHTYCLSVHPENLGLASGPALYVASTLLMWTLVEESLRWDFRSLSCLRKCLAAVLAGLTISALWGMFSERSQPAKSSTLLECSAESQGYFVNLALKGAEEL